MIPQPDIRPTPTGYTLASDYAVPISWPIFLIPKGFDFDGASSPRPLWPIMPPDGVHRAAVLVHDFLYRYKGDLSNGGCPGTVLTRKNVDYIFLYLMRKAEVSFFVRYSAYWAVRAFGWICWGKST